MPRLRSTLSVAAVFLVGAGLACGGEDGGAGPPAFPVLIAEETLRIGSVEDDEDAFTWFRALEVAFDGRIFTIHPTEDLVRIHGPDGESLGTLVGVGEGPGEFSSPRSLGFLGDTIWVLDGGTYRFSYFELDGSFLGTVRIPIDLGTGGVDDPARPSGLLSDGTMWGASPAWSSLVASGEITQSAYLRLAPDGSVVDTIAAFSLVNTSLAVQREGGGGFYTRQPYSDTEIVTLSRHRPEVIRVDRSVSGAGDRAVFRVSKLSLERDTIWSREYGYLPVAFDHSVADSFARRFAENVAESGFMPRGRAEEELREALYRPQTFPPVDEVVAGRDGSVWLELGGPPSDVDRWWILSPDGDPVGEVELPRRFRVITADRERAWGMATDALDVPYIVRYTIRQPTATE